MENILLDVDDTLTDFLYKRNKLIKKYLKDKNLNYKIVDMNATKSAKVSDWPLDECVNFWHEIGTEEQLKCKAQKHCAEVVKNLKDNGNKIFIVTARPSIYFEAYKYTKLWLDKNNICYDEIITGKLDKKETMKKLGISLVIDDSTLTINSASELNIKSFLFTTKENKDFELPAGCTRVRNWKEIEKSIFKNK